MAGPAAVVALNQAVQLVGQVTDALRKIPDAVRGFVDAFNPAAGQRLDFAFRSLYATIGFGLQPVLSAATRIVEGFAGAINEGMTRLAGPIEKVSAAFAGVLRPAIEAAGTVVDVLADAADALMPLLEPLGTALEGLAVVTKVLTAIFAHGLLAVVQALVPGTDSLAAATDWLKLAFLQLAEASIRYAAIVLRLVKQEGLLVPMIEAILKDPAKQGRPGANQNFQIGALDEIYRRRLLAAAQGAGKDVGERTFDVMKDVRELLKEMLDNIKNKPEVFERQQNAFEQGARDALRATPLGRIMEQLWNLFDGGRQGQRNRP